MPDRAPAPAADPVAVAAQVAATLADLRREVPGVLASLVATSDGLLVASDTADGARLPGEQLAALTSTLTALAGHAVGATRGGDLVDAVVRGTDGVLAVFALGETAALAVVADPDVTVAWLNLRTRPVVERLCALSDGFGRFSTG